MIKQETQLHFLHAIYNNGELWFNAIGWNAYYKMNIQTGNISLLGKFEYADFFSDKLFYCTLAYQQYIFFIPWFFDYLVRLDTITLETKYWKVPKEIEMEIAKFRSAYIYQEKIVMLPMLGNIICIFDIKTSKFMCDISWKQKEWKINGDFMQGCQIEDNMYVPILTKGLILKYNFIRGKHDLIIFPEKEKGIVRVEAYNYQELLVLTRNGNIWKYNMVNGKNKILYQYNGNKDCPYSNLGICNKKIYLLPAHEEKIHVLSGEKIYSLSYPPEWKTIMNYAGIDWCITNCWTGTDSMLLYPALGNMVLILNTKTDMLRGIKINEKMCWDFFMFNIKDDSKIKKHEKKKIGSQIWNKIEV